WEYSTTEEFTTFLRSHLEMHLRNWGTQWGNNNAHSPPNSNVTLASPSEKQIQKADEGDDVGLYELAQSAEQEFTVARSSIDEIGAGMQKLAEEITRIGAKLEALKNPLGQPDQKKVTSLFNEGAEQMEKYARKLDLETPKMAEHYAAGFEAVSRSITLS